MRKILTLEVEYLDLKTKKLSPEDEQTKREQLFKKAVKEFKAQVKDLMDSNNLKVIKDYYPRHEILVEYNTPEIYQRFLKLDIVRIIDSHIY